MKKRAKSKIDIQDIAIAIVGGALAGKVANINIPFIPEKFRPAVPLVVSYFLLKGGKSMKAAGTGMAVVGGIKTLNAFVPQLGIGAGSESISEYFIEGPADYALNGPTESMSGNTSYALSGVSDEVNSDYFG